MVIDAEGRLLASRCPVLHVRGNQYYAPTLERNPGMARAARWLRTHGLGCGHGRQGVAARNDQDMVPFFAATSRHFFVPHAATSHRAELASANVTAGVMMDMDRVHPAVIGVHVRSTILFALHKNYKANADSVLRTFGFIDCVAKVRNASAGAYAGGSRVYIAGDSPMVRKEALRVWGAEGELVPPPSYLFAGREVRGHMTTNRGFLATSGAIDEMLLLSRLDGLIVWDLRESTYSAAAASWAAHREGRTRPWLGVHVVSQGCTRLPDSEVEPVPQFPGF